MRAVGEDGVFCPTLLRVGESCVERGTRDEMLRGDPPKSGVGDRDCAKRPRTDWASDVDEEAELCWCDCCFGDAFVFALRLGFGFEFGFRTGGWC